MSKFITSIKTINGIEVLLGKDLEGRRFIAVDSCGGVFAYKDKPIWDSEWCKWLNLNSDNYCHVATIPAVVGITASKRLTPLCNSAAKELNKINPLHTLDAL